MKTPFKAKCDCCGLSTPDSTLVYLDAEWEGLSFRSLVRPECKTSIHQEILNDAKRANTKRNV